MAKVKMNIIYKIVPRERDFMEMPESIFETDDKKEAAKKLIELGENKYEIIEYGSPAN